MNASPSFDILDENDRPTIPDALFGNAEIELTDDDLVDEHDRPTLDMSVEAA